ncbi:MAG: efflux RND transporter periplasmic adaptor subunit [Desulfofustis sp.]
MLRLFTLVCVAAEVGVEKKAPPPLAVEVISVNNESVPLWISFTGRTEATKRVEVRARVSGRLDQVLFTEGDYVNEGDTLFVLEKDTYEAALAQAQAQLQKNQASLKLARADVERYRPLVAEDLAPRATLEQYEAREAELIAAIKADEAAIKEAELNLSYTDVSAPISGRVSRKLVDTGNIVGYGEQTVLTTIVSDNPMYAYFNPTEFQFQAMRTHKSQDQMPAIVNVSEDKQGLVQREPLRGEVDFSDNRVDNTTGTISMRAQVANDDHSLLEGTFVYVEVMITDQASFLLIPPGVVQEDQQGSYVYVVDENNTAKRVNIKSGYESRYYMIVTEGLEGGEKIVISGFAKLRPGVSLEPKDVSDSKGIKATLQKQGMMDTEA